MSLHYPGTRRERILAFGISGAGKSSIWLCIAEWIAKTDSKSKLHVIDTDHAWEAMRPADGRLDEIVNVYQPFDYRDYRPAVHAIEEAANPDDWYVIDRADVMKEASEEGYTHIVEGKDFDEFLLGHVINQTSPAGDYGKTARTMRIMHQKMGLELVNRWPGHVLMCTSADRLYERSGSFGDPADIFKKYQPVNCKPSGYAKLAHLVHTEICMMETPKGYQMTTLKDRKPFGEEGRPYMRGKEVTPDFVMAYLMGIAGWRL